MTLWRTFPFFRLSTYSQMEHILSMSNGDNSAERYGYECKKIFETVPFCSNGPAGPYYAHTPCSFKSPIVSLIFIVFHRRTALEIKLKQLALFMISS